MEPMKYNWLFSCQFSIIIPNDFFPFISNISTTRIIKSLVLQALNIISCSTNFIYDFKMTPI